MAGEAGTTRIGAEGKQTRTFVSGIYPTALTGCFVQVTSEGELGCNKNAAAEGKEGPQGKEGKEGPQGKEGKEGKAGAEGKEGKEGKVSTKGLKICVQEKAGGHIRLPPCKKGYTEKEVAEL